MNVFGLTHVATRHDDEGDDGGDRDTIKTLLV